MAKLRCRSSSAAAAPFQGARLPSSTVNNLSTPGSDQWIFAASPVEFERQRLTLLERVHDPQTIRWLNQVPFEPTWQCLEIGAGGGSITARYRGTSTARRSARHRSEVGLALFRQSGTETTFGLRVPTLLTQFGAEIIESEGSFAMGGLKSPSTEFRLATAVAARRLRVAQGLEIPPQSEAMLEILQHSQRYRAGVAVVSTLARAAG